MQFSMGMHVLRESVGRETIVAKRVIDKRALGLRRDKGLVFWIDLVHDKNN